MEKPRHGAQPTSVGPDGNFAELLCSFPNTGEATAEVRRRKDLAKLSVGLKDETCAKCSCLFLDLCQIMAWRATMLSASARS